MSLTKTVLYVEDDESDRFFMARAFSSIGLGSVLKTVMHGESALDYLSGHHVYSDRSLYPLPSLMLLDLNLPLVSGFEVLDWVRRHPVLAALPVVIFSGSCRVEDRECARHLGANDYYAKPVSGLEYSPIAAALATKWLGPHSASAPLPFESVPPVHT